MQINLVSITHYTCGRRKIPHIVVYQCIIAKNHTDNQPHKFPAEAHKRLFPFITTTINSIQILLNSLNSQLSDAVRIQNSNSSQTNCDSQCCNSQTNQLAIKSRRERYAFRISYTYILANTNIILIIFQHQERANRLKHQTVKEISM